MFADAGCTYLRPMIINSTKPGADPQAADVMRRLFSLVIKCAAHAEPSVSEATFTFWRWLYEELGEMQRRVSHVT